MRPVTLSVARFARVDFILLQDCALVAVVTAFRVNPILAVSHVIMVILFKMEFVLILIASVRLKSTIPLSFALQDVLSVPFPMKLSTAFLLLLTTTSIP